MGPCVAEIQFQSLGVEGLGRDAGEATKAVAKGLFGREKSVNEPNAFKAIRNFLTEGL